ncbi:MAG: 23S rRNA (guanosine(2251)-2'-O)-methyltransferase RlmB [Bacilli bacterium]|jgi:23S rRNA (guanosine2251-2'-O)-methyltransferase|nr:23S rRNA (guanosine(2251)-2'-O)-methyltransferase RlmB [Bacilli bacterium]
MSDLIYGRNPCLNAFEGKRKPSKVYISKTMADKSILDRAQKKGLEVEMVSNGYLDKITNFKNHQGVACYLPKFAYSTLEELINIVNSKGRKDSTILILDGIEDPVNFGSLIRTASCFDCDGIIISKNRQVQVTPVVSKVATGAEETLPIALVTNISQAIQKLKDVGYWIVSADGKGDTLYDQIDYSGRIGIIIGSEGRGISQLVLKNSDFVARIPISGPITSLNAAISGALFLGMVASYRSKKK